ncbi:ATP-dependent nuclease [Tenacibaculum aiptasiae]|uniref:ATP-dependent nuclease n=1 Tax=Tenacibaculum aiptasiae TaxID=426481 RepID=UPI003B5A126B
MYIEQIEIDNFRNFSPAKEGCGTVIKFSEGTNVIIGHNNAGKTNLLKALQLVFDSKKMRGKLTIDDFCKEYSDFSKPPEINITVTFKEQEDELADDKVVVYDWITKPNKTYEAQLTFSFFLPQGDDYKEYCEEVVKFQTDGKFNTEKTWRFIKKYFFSKYVARVYGGMPNNKEIADYEMLEKFDFQFLDAIRDAEKQMFFGHNTILKEVLNYFLDFEITDGKKIKDLSAKAKKELKEKEAKFETTSESLFQQLKDRISKENILKYSEETGANKGGHPDFDVHVSEEDLLFALRLIVKLGDIKVPISKNGLGYNNLLYIALVLAKMQIESQRSYYGENAKVFPILAIEEPEAHLHPAMQYKFIKFLKENIDKEGKVRQLFVTSHSTHVTSAVELDNIICLYKGENKIEIGYPGKSFGDKIESKNYVKRFLDATKSNMLFSDKVIFVEGLAEQLLLPVFAAYKLYDKKEKITNEDELINQHISIISVDSRTFKHFLYLYSHSKENPYAINKKVVCITDSDPEIKGSDNKWRACFPFQLKKTERFKAIASHVSELKTNFSSKYTNISIAHPVEGLGKTLEYELARYNPNNKLLITDSFPTMNSPHTADNFKKIQDEHLKDPKDYLKVLNVYESFMKTEKQKQYFTFLKTEILGSSFSDMEKSATLIATIYYTIVKSLKGEHALYLERNLREDISNSTPKFIVPTYIKDAITEILK